jgi:hypothetical protein
MKLISMLKGCKHNIQINVAFDVASSGEKGWERYGNVCLLSNVNLSMNLQKNYNGNISSQKGQLSGC